MMFVAFLIPFGDQIGFTFVGCWKTNNNNLFWITITKYDFYTFQIYFIFYNKIYQYISIDENNLNEHMINVLKF